ncbi:MAG: sodium:solute symporter [candidate division KSB1 bacterium]|nr:sodium:solute symporter [candidate division KSB1 bacterium]MDZ7334134.1 sodium:solute symporter [candidate division KSB1 bacterium]MDZ7357382.1 sodium:solute symporter [candidate division KSB1 bacterium]MDZ7401370.1 sodium:solute symporter [candidate division KSB1 bacterium]
MGSALGWIDLTVVAGYFIIILGLAWWVIRQRQNTTTDYFLAGRHLGWFIIGASIFASNIGSEHLVGLAGSGATDGVAMAHYELHAWCLLVLAWVMVPFYMRSKVFTMPEFLERRFSPTARTVLSVISLVAYVLTKIAVGIFAGGVVFSVLLPDVNFMGLDSFWVGSILVIVLTGIYTILGGLRAVAYTEALQTIILIIGSMLVTVFGLKAIGGWSELRAVAGSEMFNLWKPLVPDGLAGTWAPVKESTRMAWYFNDNYPWLGMLFCAPIIGLWYWCTDQYIVQRALGAPNEREARRGSIWAAYLKLLPVFIFIIPGIISFALAKSGKVAAIQQVFFDGSGNLLRDRAQEAFPLLVAHVLPVGVRGIVVAGLLAALMSSLAGVFNASSTLFTMDFYSRLRPQSTQQHLVWVGRLATAVMVLIGLLWIPVIRGGKGLYDYLQGVQSYLAPPIFVVFFFGVFMKRLNAKGCLAALITGFLLGLFRMAVDTPVKLIGNFQYEYGSFLWIVNHIYFQYYSLLIFIISIIIMIVVSYLTEEPSYDRITGLTFSTMTEEHRRQTRESWNYKDVVYSMIVLALILAAYLYFTG